MRLSHFRVHQQITLYGENEPPAGSWMVGVRGTTAIVAEGSTVVICRGANKPAILLTPMGYGVEEAEPAIVEDFVFRAGDQITAPEPPPRRKPGRPRKDNP